MLLHRYKYIDIYHECTEISNSYIFINTHADSRLVGGNYFFFYKSKSYLSNSFPVSCTIVMDSQLNYYNAVNIINRTDFSTYISVIVIEVESVKTNAKNEVYADSRFSPQNNRFFCCR